MPACKVAIGIRDAGKSCCFVIIAIHYLVAPFYPDGGGGSGFFERRGPYLSDSWAPFTRYVGPSSDDSASLSLGFLISEVGIIPTLQDCIENSVGIWYVLPSASASSEVEFRLWT